MSELIVKQGKLQLSEIEVNEDYRKEWNIHLNDFCVLSRDGELLNNILYRKGGLNHNLDVANDKYFMLLKHTEEIYDFAFMKKAYPSKSKAELEKQRKHLKSEWVILDNNGVEKYVNTGLHSPYLVKNSCIFSTEKNYYNIETKYFYGSASGSILQSKDYIFLDNSYGGPDKPLVSSYKTEHPAGIVKINKLTGEFEVFEK
jgi:hypothetical protein